MIFVICIERCSLITSPGQFCQFSKENLEFCSRYSLSGHIMYIASYYHEERAFYFQKYLPGGYGFTKFDFQISFLDFSIQVYEGLLKNYYLVLNDVLVI